MQDGSVFQGTSLCFLDQYIIVPLGLFVVVGVGGRVLIGRTNLYLSMNLCRLKPGSSHSLPLRSNIIKPGWWIYLRPYISFSPREAVLDSSLRVDGQIFARSWHFGRLIFRERSQSSAQPPLRPNLNHPYLLNALRSVYPSYAPGPGAIV